MNKKITIIILVLLVLLTSACGNKGKLHSKEEIENYLNKLDCYTDTNNKNKPCNIKNKYNVIDEKVYDDEHGQVRELTLKLKEYDIEFKAQSSYQCTGSLDASCFEYTYTISTDYQYKVYDYFHEEFFKKNNLSCANIYLDRDDCSYNFKVNSREEISKTSKIIKEYLDYLNSFDFKFVPAYMSVDIVFPKAQNNYMNYYLSFDLKIENGKYIYEERVYINNKLDHVEKVTDIENSIQKYINENIIF